MCTGQNRAAFCIEVIEIINITGFINKLNQGGKTIKIKNGKNCINKLNNLTYTKKLPYTNKNLPYTYLLNCLKKIITVLNFNWAK